MTPLVLILGAGPAGCAAARLLAAWGHRVLVIERPDGDRRALAESIPPSADRVLGTLGMLPAVRDAGFHPWRGNTVWWGNDQARVETFPIGVAGHQVDRSRFDRLLRHLALEAGADVRAGLVRDVVIPTLAEPSPGESTGTSVLVEADGRTERIGASFVLDCSGRAGLIARHGRRRLRRAESSHRTIALAGQWRATHWPGADDGHTLVAAYTDGWAWSVATEPGLRQFTVMVDPVRSDLARRMSSRDVYLAELAKVGPFQPLLQAAALTDAPWGADASVYDARRYSGPDFLLVGDAASFIDPLSSFGVKKALASGWLAAIATHTALTRPDMQDAALAFYDRREREVYAAARARSAQFAVQASARTAEPFWLARAATLDDPHTWSDIDTDALARDVDVLAAFDDLKRRSAIALEPSPTVTVLPRALVRGREIVLDDHIVLPDAPDGVRYLRGIDLVALTRLAPAHRDVGDLCAAVARHHPGVALPDILGALSFLIARGALAHAPA